MLSPTVFAVAASAAAQSAPALKALPPDPAPAERKEVKAAAVGTKPERHVVLWKYADPAIDGGHIWL